MSEPIRLLKQSLITMSKIVEAAKQRGEEERRLATKHEADAAHFESCIAETNAAIALLEATQ